MGTQLKIGKLPYVGNVLTDLHDIWHGVTHWTYQPHWTERDAVCRTDSCVPKEPHISWWCTLALPGQYNCTISMWRPQVGCPKTAEPIEMQFRGHTPVGPTNHVLDGLHIDATWCIPAWFDGHSAKMAQPIKMPFRELTHAGSKKNVLVGWAHQHWSHLVNTVKPWAIPAKSHQRIEVQHCVQFVCCRLADQKFRHLAG